MTTSDARSLMAIDIGNSRIKLGRFDCAANSSDSSGVLRQSDLLVQLPEPVVTLELPIANTNGEFDPLRLHDWCNQYVVGEPTCLVGSVHRGAADRFAAAMQHWAEDAGRGCTLERISNRDVPLVMRVDEPERVGIDRLLAALAASRIRTPERAAIIVDLGTAITVDVLQADGSFAGGAILPGIAMSARALAEQTDALPQVVMKGVERPPAPLGKSTIPAIESGLYWGAIGGIRELVFRMSADLASPPDLFFTGGTSQHLTPWFASGTQSVRCVPHLVLAGIALVGRW